MPKTTYQIRKIDIEKVIRSQEHKLIKNLPGFVIYLLKKIIKEKELNELIELGRTKKNIDYISAVLQQLNIKSEVIGPENVPKNNNLIIAANHALGGMDYFALMFVLKNRFPVVKSLANEILLNVDPLKEIFLPVNVFGKNSEKNKKLVDEAMADNQTPIFIFPSGEVARKYHGKMDDGKWRSGFIRYALEYKRDILPVFIAAENSKFFYRLAGFRRFIGLKANLELFLLPREILKQKNKSIKIIIGKPILHSTFNRTKNVKEWATKVKEKVYQLGENR